MWQELRDGLRAFIRKRVADDAEVEDILQEVFLRVHQRLDTVNNPRRMLSWVYQITRHAIVDHYRALERRKEMPVGDAFDIETVGTAPATLVPEQADSGEDGRELAGCLHPMIEQLGKQYQEAVRLVELDGLTQQEAAKRIGLSFSGMKSRVQRGRQQLERMLRDCCRIELDARNGVSSYAVRDQKRSPC
jgi:RNA polymerase sigma-70 factor (ECF subfamily)